MELTQHSETSVFNTQMPGKYPEDNLSLLQHGESLKSRIIVIISVIELHVIQLKAIFQAKARITYLAAVH